MNPTLLGLALGLTLGAGAAILALAATIPPTPNDATDTAGTTTPARSRLGDISGVRGGAAVAAGVITLLATGWPIAAVLIGLAALTVPQVLTVASHQLETVKTTEAVAGWAEMLRDAIAGASGIEEAIGATAPNAPHRIREPVQRLAARLERDRLHAALDRFAAEVDQPADRIAALLGFASRQPARNLGSILTDLAAVARRAAVITLRATEQRRQVRTTVRVTLATTIGLAAALPFIARDFLAAGYGDAIGQAWLVVVGLIFAAGLRLLRRLGTFRTPPRFSFPHTDDTPEAAWEAH